MLSNSQISQAKAVSIVAVLSSRGVLPVSQIGQELAYRSPVTEERSPSLFVNPVLNVFTDYSGQQRGDVIRLVQHLTGCNFRQAVETLLGLVGVVEGPAFSFSGPSLIEAPRKGDKTALTITEARPLHHPALLRYAAERGIGETLAVRYCREVYYHNRGSHFFALGFANDRGGWELRAERFKGCSSPKGISTFEVPGSDRVCLFEGFFDFLSALTWYGLTRPRYTSIVLNSTSNLKQAIPRLGEAKRINGFLDNDRAGKALGDRLQREGFPFTDCSTVYARCKDFNDLLLWNV